jgi:hypothetical protein
MSTRSALGTRIDDDTDRTVADTADTTLLGSTGRWQCSRYDLLLVLLPLPLVLGLGWATLTAAPMSAGVSLGSVPTLAVLAYSLFVGGPTTPDTDTFDE